MDISSLNNNCYIKTISEDIKNNTYLQESSYDEEKDLSKQVTSLNKELREAKNKQGAFGSVWNDIKNLTGAGLSTNDLNEKIELFKKGEADYEEVLKSIESFENKQENAVNIFYNLLTGALTCAAISAGIASGGILAGILAGTLVAGATNASFKFVERLTNKIKNDEFDKEKIENDLTTGCINGLTSSLSAGIVQNNNTVTILKESIELEAKKEITDNAISSGISSFLSGAGNYISETAQDKEANFDIEKLINSAGEDMCMGILTGGATKGVFSVIKYSVSDNPEIYSDIMEYDDSAEELIENIQLEIQSAYKNEKQAAENES